MCAFVDTYPSHGLFKSRVHFLLGGKIEIKGQFLR